MINESKKSLEPLPRGASYFTSDPNKEAAYKAAEELLYQITSKVPESQIQATAENAREARRKAGYTVDDTVDNNAPDKRISPVYWVTQNDFKQAFGRNYNPMNETDRQDFFSLVKNAPGMRRRTDVAGADSGAPIASRQRPEFIPTFQDVDGVKVPESALGYTAKEQKRARDLGFKSIQDFKDAEKYDGSYSDQPRRLIQQEVDKNLALDRQMNLLGISRQQIKKPGVMPYSERQPNPLENQDNLLKFVQTFAPETLTPEQKSKLNLQPKTDSGSMPYSERQDNPFDQSLVNGVQTSNKNAADKITDKVGQFVNIVPSYEPRSESETIFDALRQIERQDIEREINRNLKSKKSLPSQARNYLDRVVSKRKV
jgi:hypothetical protein